MTTGTKIALGVGIPLVLISGFLILKKMNSIKLVSWDNIKKEAILKVGFKEVIWQYNPDFPVPTTLASRPLIGYVSFSPAYRNESDKENTFYGIHVKNDKGQITDTITIYR